ncbi:hypothetical protein QBA75_38910 [Streptomyces stelliscabiei]
MGRLRARSTPSSSSGTESDGYLVLDDRLYAQEVDLYLSELRTPRR